MAAVEVKPHRVPCKATEHRYEARHDEITNVEATSSANFWNKTTARIVDRVWVADVCQKCGDMIPRPRAVK